MLLSKGSSRAAGAVGGAIPSEKTVSIVDHLTAHADVRDTTTDSAAFSLRHVLDHPSISAPVPKGTPLLEFSLSTGNTCLRSSDVKPWTQELRKNAWIIKKYITGYSFNETLLWSVVEVADIELLFSILELRARADPRFTLIVAPLANKIREKLLYYKYKPNHDGYPPAIEYAYRQTHHAVQQGYSVLNTFRIYQSLPDESFQNISQEDVAQWLPIIQARAVTLTSGCRALCLPFLLFDHSSSADVTMHGSQMITSRSLPVGVIPRGGLSFDFTSGGYQPTVQRSVFRYGGACNDFEPVDLHLEFADTPALNTLRCELRQLSLNLEGRATDLEALMLCLMTATLPLEQQREAAQRLEDQSMRHDLMVFLEGWVQAMRDVNYTTAVTKSESDHPSLSKEIACTIRYVRSVFDKAVTFFQSEQNALRSLQMEDPKQAERRKEAILAGKGPYDRFRFLTQGLYGRG